MPCAPAKVRVVLIYTLGPRWSPVAQHILACSRWRDLESRFCLGQEKKSSLISRPPQVPHPPSPLGPEWSGSFFTQNRVCGALPRLHNYSQPAWWGWKTLTVCFLTHQSNPYLQQDFQNHLQMCSRVAGFPESSGLRPKVLSAVPFSPVSQVPSPSRLVCVLFPIPGHFLFYICP